MSGKATSALGGFLGKEWKKLKSSLKAMDSLDAVELVMAIEEAFDVTISDRDAEAMQTPRDMITWLLPMVCGHLPNKIASGKLKKISLRDNLPDLIPQPDRPWRREQVAAVVREIIVEQTGTTRFAEDSSFRDDILS